MVGLALGLAALAGCGLPDDSGPRDIPPGFALDADESSTVAPATASTSGPKTYFVGGAGEPGTLVGVSRDVQANDLTNVLRALLDGPTTSEQSRGLRTAIPEGTQLLDARVLPDGTARVNLNDAIFTATRRRRRSTRWRRSCSPPPTREAVSSRSCCSSMARARAGPVATAPLENKPLTPFMYPALDPTSEPDYVPFPVGGQPEPAATTTTTTISPPAVG